MSIAIVVEASLSSERLPGKILLTLAGRTLLEHSVRLPVAAYLFR